MKKDLTFIGRPHPNIFDPHTALKSPINSGPYAPRLALEQSLLKSNSEIYIENWDTVKHL